MGFDSTLVRGFTDLAKNPVVQLLFGGFGVTIILLLLKLPQALWRKLRGSPASAAIHQSPTISAHQTPTLTQAPVNTFNPTNVFTPVNEITINPPATGTPADQLAQEEHACHGAMERQLSTIENESGRLADVVFDDAQDARRSELASLVQRATTNLRSELQHHGRVLEPAVTTAIQVVEEQTNWLLLYGTSRMHRQQNAAEADVLRTRVAVLAAAKQARSAIAERTRTLRGGGSSVAAPSQPGTQIELRLAGGSTTTGVVQFNLANEGGLAKNVQIIPRNFRIDRGADIDFWRSGAAITVVATSLPGEGPLEFSVDYTDATNARRTKGFRFALTPWSLREATISSALGDR